MKKLIVTADDFGVYSCINEGIRAAVRKGKVNSVACLSNYAPGIPEIKALNDEFGDRIDMGCHLTISSGEPITLKGDGDFAYGNYFRPFGELEIDDIERQPEKLKRELKAQVETLKDNNIPVKHISCHHNTLTTTRPLFKVYREVAADYNIPMRSVNINPTNKDSDFRLALKILLFDDVRPKKLREMKAFGKLIMGECGTTKMPAFLETRHYGPLPFVDLWEPGYERRVRKKQKDLKGFFKEYITMDCTTAELVLHLVDYKLFKQGNDNEVKYPGINQRYFDSRHIEFESIMGYDYDLHFGKVGLGRWGEL